MLTRKITVETARAGAAAVLPISESGYLSGAAQEQVRQGLSAGDRRRSRHTRERKGEQLQLFASVAAVEDSALDVGRHHRRCSPSPAGSWRRTSSTPRRGAWKTKCKPAFRRTGRCGSRAADRLASVSLILSRCRTCAPRSARAIRLPFATRRASCGPRSPKRTCAVSGDRSEGPADRIARRRAGVGGLARAWRWCAQAARHFPQKKQASGFMLKDGHLYQVARHAGVRASRAAASRSLDVLVAGYRVDPLVAQQLKESTGGSEFLFLSEGRVIASTLNPRATGELTRKVAGARRGPQHQTDQRRRDRVRAAGDAAPGHRRPHHRRAVDLPLVRERAPASWPCCGAILSCSGCARCWPAWA